MTDRFGHVYQYVAEDDWPKNLYLVIGRNDLSHTSYGQLWNVICLDAYEGMEDEWDNLLGDARFYRRIK